MKKRSSILLATIAGLTLSGCSILGIDIPNIFGPGDDPGEHQDEEVHVESVSLSESNINLDIGASTDLTYTVLPENAKNKDVIWSINDESVASVDNGHVTGLKEGSAVITLKSVDGEKSAVCDVTVVKSQPEIVHVESVSLNETSISLKTGDTYTLIETVLPLTADNKNVTWSSSNTNVATVSNGVVAAKAKGNTTITVKTEDGGKTAQCMVSVTESQEIDTITPEEAVSIIKGLDSGVVSSKEYSVRGVAANVEMDANGFNGGFLNSNLKFRSVQGNGLASSVDDINGKEVIIFGYLELYNEIYQIPYLPAYASPTGEKYNAKLTYVESGGEQEEIAPTNISISPVNKTINVNETATLFATVLPQNATYKTVTWATSKSSVCTVTSSGEIKGISEGSAAITATTVNGLTATCNVTVTKSSVTPVTGDTFTIKFNKFESDGQTELNVGTLMDQVSEGSSYIGSVEYCSKLYKGMSGIKFGSSRSGGELEFIVADSLKNKVCKEIDLVTKTYGTNSTTVRLEVDGEEIALGSSSDAKIAGVLTTPKAIEDIDISTSARAYLESITIICENSTPVPVTGISITSAKAISIGNSETISVTYSPSNANTGKGIIWKSSNASVATVNNGVVTGVSAGTATITATSEGGFTATCTVTVSNVAVTSVSISPTTAALSVGSTKQLSATVLPTNATNKNVSWSSNNTSVASVSSTGLVTAKAVGTATITATADGGKTATCSVTVQEQQNDAWTIMIYMCGADLESESGLASGDIKEILSVKNQPENVNILIETGGAKSWSLSSTYLSGATKIDASKLSRWHVENKKLVLDETLTYASMGSSSTLQSFVEWGIKEYPAEKTGVIFWNHGGAMYGCCYDEKKNDDSLVNSEMKTAFNKALANTGSSKLEFVGYDTCLTQVQDIAEFNSNYFNYMIASEEYEAGEGWDYDTWVDDLYANKPTETILKAIVDGFITDNGGVNSTSSDQTLSFLDLNQMPAYKTAFESFASALKSKLSNSSVSKSTFAKWMDSNVKAFCVDSDQDEAYYCLFDVKDMLNKLSSNSTYNPGSTYISNLQTAFSNLVKYSVAQKGAGNAYGLGCIYCQSSTYSSYIKSAYTSTETNFSNWLSFLNTYSYLA